MPSRKAGRIPRVSTRFSLSVENELADKGRGGRTVSRDRILRRERGHIKNILSCSADHEQDWQPYPVEVLTIHTLKRSKYFGTSFDQL